MRYLMGLTLAAALAVGALSGCRKQSSQYAPPPPPKVTVCQPHMQQVVDYADYTGNTAALETVDLRARVGGYLTSVNYKAGTVVKKGDLLFVIDPQPYELAVQQAQAELDARMAQVTLQEATLKQYLDARSKNAATEFEVLTATGNRDAARAAVLAAKANLEQAKLNLGYTHVYAPFDGLINRTQVDVGNLVGVSSPTVLATILRFDPIYVYFSIGEHDLLDYMRVARASGAFGKTAGLPISLGLGDEDGFPHEGAVDSTENRLDSNTGTITVRGIFPNSDRALLSGLFVRVRLPLGKVQATLIPDVAVCSDQGGQFVLVVNDKNVVEIRRVVIGKLYGGLRNIVHGLTDKDWVVINGLQRARPGSAVNPDRQAIRAALLAEVESASQPAASQPATDSATAPAQQGGD